MDGLLTEVTEVAVGSHATATAAVGATSVAVEDITPFVEGGGIIDILGVRYTTTAATADASIVDDSGDMTTTGVLTLLGAGLTAQVDPYDPVSVVVGGDVATTATAIVDIPQGTDSTAPGDGGPVHVTLDYTQRAVFPVGPYAPPLPVALTDDLTAIAQVPDVRPTINGAAIDPTTLPERVPTEAPANSPAIVVQGLTSSLLVKAEDVDQTTTIDYHISTTSGFTPGPTTLSLTTRSTVVAIDQLPDTTPLAQGTTYYLVAVATNVAGDAAPSAQVSATLVQITTTQIADDSITTPMLQAGSITADIVAGGTFEAGYTLTGSLQVGNITLTPGGGGDPGGLLIPLASGGKIQLPADGSDAWVQANLHALSVTVDDNLMVHGTGNDLAGTLTVDNIPQAPKVKPTVTPVSLLTGTGFQVQGGPAGATLGSGDGTTLNVWDGGNMLGVNKTTGATSTALGFTTINNSFFGQGPFTLYAAAVVGSVVVIAYSLGSSTALRARVYGGSGLDFALTGWSTPKSYSTIALGADSSGNLLVAGTPTPGTNTAHSVATFNITTGATVSTVALNAPTFAATTPINPTAVVKGELDYGTGNTRTVVAFSDTTRVYNGGTEQTANRFGGGSTASRGMAWDGTSFWVKGNSGNTGPGDMRKLSSAKTAVAHTAKWTQYCDGTRTGSTGTHETKASPTNTVTQTVRGYLSVTTPPPADGGGANDPNGVRIYVDSHLQTTLTSGWTASYDTYNTTNADSPTTEGFVGVSGMTVGVIQSQATGTDGLPAFQVKGDGTLKLGGAATTIGALGGIQFGTVLLTFSAQTSQTATVTFPKAFNTAPVVVQSIRQGFASTLFVSRLTLNPTATGFTVQVDAVDGVNHTGTVTVSWIAIGGS